MNHLAEILEAEKRNSDGEEEKTFQNRPISKPNRRRSRQHPSAIATDPDSDVNDDDYESDPGLSHNISSDSDGSEPNVDAHVTNSEVRRESICIAKSDANSTLLACRYTPFEVCANYRTWFGSEKTEAMPESFHRRGWRCW